VGEATGENAGSISRLVERRVVELRGLGIVLALVTGNEMFSASSMNARQQEGSP
jgi:hypothetical protein